MVSFSDPRLRPQGPVGGGGGTGRYPPVRWSPVPRAGGGNLIGSDLICTRRNGVGPSHDPDDSARRAVAPAATGSPRTLCSRRPGFREISPVVFFIL